MAPASTASTRRSGVNPRPVRWCSHHDVFVGLAPEVVDLVVLAYILFGTNPRRRRIWLRVRQISSSLTHLYPRRNPPSSSLNLKTPDEQLDGATSPSLDLASTEPPRPRLDHGEAAVRQGGPYGGEPRRR